MSFIVRDHSPPIHLDMLPLRHRQRSVLSLTPHLTLTSLPPIVYTNSLLAMLNSRHPYHGRGLNEEESLNTRSRSIDVNTSRSIAGPGGGTVGDDGQRKSTLFTSPVSPLNIDSKVCLSLMVVGVDHVKLIGWSVGWPECSYGLGCCSVE